MPAFGTRLLEMCSNVGEAATKLSVQQDSRKYRSQIINYTNYHTGTVP